MLKDCGNHCQRRSRPMSVSRTTWGHLAGAILIVLALLLSHAPVLNAAPEITVIATSTPGRFEIVATDFEDDEEVSAWVTGPSQQVAAVGETHTANENGRASFHVRMPRHSQPG